MSAAFRSGRKAWLLTIAGLAIAGGAALITFRQGIAPVTEASAAGARIPREGHDALQPVPAPAREDPRKVALGARLFTDRRLSGDGTLSCATCHDLAHGGADGRPTAIGIGGAVGHLNTPTVFNAALNPKQFWDGRSVTLEAQVGGPIEHPSEMGSRWADVVERLERDPETAAAFEAIYAGKPTRAGIEDAIATYERTLIMRGSRFDRYLGGETNALGTKEQEGFRLFKSYGCVTCHQGRNVGGNLFERLGIVGDYFEDRGTEILREDLGRYNVTKRPEDRFRFRVPSLRLATSRPRTCTTARRRPSRRPSS